MLTMLKATRKKKAKVKTPINKRLPNHVIKQVGHIKTDIAVTAVEYFMAIHDALDWVEDHCPKDLEKV